MLGFLKRRQRTTEEVLPLGHVVEGILVVKISLAEHWQTLLVQVVRRALANGSKKIALDLSSVVPTYSFELGELVKCFGEVHAAGGKLSLLTPHAQIRRVLSDAHLVNMLPIYGSEHEMLKAWH